MSATARVIASARAIARDAPARQGQHVHRAGIRWSLIHRLREVIADLDRETGDLCPRCGGDIHDHVLVADESSDTDVHRCAIDILDDAIDHADSVVWTPDDAEVQPLIAALRSTRDAYAGHLILAEGR